MWFPGQQSIQLNTKEKQIKPQLVISYFEYAENYICLRRSGDSLKIVK
jgi:hypothetical protein